MLFRQANLRKFEGEITMVNIKGKWALITGASRGLGRLAAKYIAEQGCNVIVHSRKKEHCAKLAEEVRAMGVKAYLLEAELSDPEQVEAMLKEIDELGVNVEIVLNNAGIQKGWHEDYCQTSVSDYTESFQVNTIAPAMICYHFLPKMIKQGFGRIVNTSSGIHLDPNQAGYSASKAALDKISVDIGNKLNGTDVMITLTDPGWCRTDMGGQNAYFPPETAIPGITLGVFMDDKKSGRRVYAPDFTGMSLEEAVEKAERELKSPYSDN